MSLRPIIGGYYCDCGPQFDGFQCATQPTPNKPALVEIIGLFYNHLMQTNTDNALLIALRQPGSVPFFVELNTPNYFILSATHRMDAQHDLTFAYTDDLRAIAQQVGIRKVADVPSIAAYYYVVRHVRIAAADEVAAFVLTLIDLESTVLYKMPFAYRSYADRGSSCQPRIKYEQW